MESKVGQVKKILKDVVAGLGYEVASKKINTLYTSPTPKAETQVVCPDCEGFGNIPTRGMTKSSAQCPKCNGTGKVPQPSTAKDEIIQQMADYICQTFTWTCGSYFNLSRQRIHQVYNHTRKIVLDRESSGGL